jgi:hypothetical protein
LVLYFKTQEIKPKGNSLTTAIVQKENPKEKPTRLPPAMPYSYNLLT